MWVHLDVVSEKVFEQLELLPFSIKRWARGSEGFWHVVPLFLSGVKSVLGRSFDAGSFWDLIIGLWLVSGVVYNSFHHVATYRWHVILSCISFHKVCRSGEIASIVFWFSIDVFSHVFSCFMSQQP